MDWLAAFGMSDVAFFRIIIFLMTTSLILLLERFIEPIRDGGAAGKVLAVVIGLVAAFGLPDSEIVRFVAGFSYYLYALLIILPLGGLIIALFKGGTEPGAQLLKAIMLVVLVFGIESLGTLLEVNLSTYSALRFSQIEPILNVAAFLFMIGAFYFGFQWISGMVFKGRKGSSSGS